MPRMGWMEGRMERALPAKTASLNPKLRRRLATDCLRSQSRRTSWRRHVTRLGVRPFRRRQSRNPTSNSLLSRREKAAEESDDRNSQECLSLSLVAAVQIPGRAPVDYFEPVVGGGGPDGSSDPVPPVAPSMEKGEGAIRRGIRKWPSSNGCTMHSQKRFSLRRRNLVQIVFLSLGHFHKQKNESSSDSGRKEIDKNRVVSFSSSSASFNCPPTLGLISRSLLPYADWNKPGSRRETQKDICGGVVKEGGDNETSSSNLLQKSETELHPSTAVVFTSSTLGPIFHLSSSATNYPSFE